MEPAITQKLADLLASGQLDHLLNDQTPKQPITVPAENLPNSVRYDQTPTPQPSPPPEPVYDLDRQPITESLVLPLMEPDLVQVLQSIMNSNQNFTINTPENVLIVQAIRDIRLLKAVLVEIRDLMKSKSEQNKKLVFENEQEDQPATAKRTTRRTAKKKTTRSKRGKTNSKT